MLQLQIVSDYDGPHRRRDHPIKTYGEYKRCTERDRVVPAIEIILTKKGDAVAHLPGYTVANPAVKPILVGERALTRKRNPQILEQLNKRRNLNSDYRIPNCIEVPAIERPFTAQEAPHLLDNLRCFDVLPSKLRTIEVDEFVITHRRNNNKAPKRFNDPVDISCLSTRSSHQATPTSLQSVPIPQSRAAASSKKDLFSEIVKCAAVKP